MVDAVGKEVVNATEIGLHDTDGIGGIELRRGHSCPSDDDVEGDIGLKRLANIIFQEMEIGTLGEMCEDGLHLGLVTTRGIDMIVLTGVRHEGLDQGGTDHAGGTGDEDVLARELLPG